MPGAARSSTEAVASGDIVCDDAALDLVPVDRQQRREEVAALVLARARYDTVGDRQDGGLHSFVFSTSLTSAITIDLSIAFAMS